MQSRKWFVRCASPLAALLGAACVFASGLASSTTTSSVATATARLVALHQYPHLTAKSKFGEVKDNPAFAGFGIYMLPAQRPDQVKALLGAPISVMEPVMRSQYGATWDTQTMVNGYNFMIDEVNAGVKVWSRLYTPAEIKADPSKKDAGMWFIPGDRGKPVAVIAPGGGFTAVASLQEGFPFARVLHKKGYNVAILKYRVIVDTSDSGPTDAERAQEFKRVDADMNRAMTMLRARATTGQLSLRNYSVWGSSAGGVVVTKWATNGAKAHGFSPPAALMAEYTPPGYTPAAATYPPCFIIDAADDGTVSPTDVADWANQLKGLGVVVEFEQFPTGLHGFGIGAGTPALGWVNRAVTFWQANSKK
jgi:acetyl esterase/lipase